MDKEPKISQTEYALKLAKTNNLKLPEFIDKCPWLIKLLHIISANKYLKKWKMIAERDKSLNLKTRYNKDVSSIREIDMSIKFYRDFDFDERYAHNPSIDAVNCKNMKKTLQKILKTLNCPSYIIEARKLKDLGNY